MGTTAQKLNKILETKEAIRTSINNKGGTLTTTDTFASYPSAIDSLPSGGGNTLKTLLDATKSCYYLFIGYNGTSVEDLISYNDTENVIDMYGMFWNCSKLTTIPQLNTSSATNMSYMFYQCVYLTTIPQLDTSKCTNMEKMFYYCFELTTIPQLDTSKCTNMVGMFNSCSKLISIPMLDTSKCTNMRGMFIDCLKLTTIPTLDTSSCTDMGSMFRGCYLLQTIDITHMNITSTSYTSAFADGCYSLTKLIIRNMPTIPKLSSDAFTNCYHFTGTTNATYNPQGLKDGRIYVPDDKVDALKTASGWSTYADIIVPLSTLVE